MIKRATPSAFLKLSFIPIQPLHLLPFVPQDPPPPGGALRQMWEKNEKKETVSHTFTSTDFSVETFYERIDIELKKIYDFSLFKLFVLRLEQYLILCLHRPGWKWSVYGVRQGFIDLYFSVFTSNLRYQHVLNGYQWSSLVAGNMIRFPLIMYVYALRLSILLRYLSLY